MGLIVDGSDKSTPTDLYSSPDAELERATERSTFDECDLLISSSNGSSGADKVEHKVFSSMEKTNEKNRKHERKAFTFLTSLFKNQTTFSPKQQISSSKNANLTLFKQSWLNNNQQTKFYENYNYLEDENDSNTNSNKRFYTTSAQQILFKRRSNDESCCSSCFLLTIIFLLLLTSISVLFKLSALIQDHKLVINAESRKHFFNNSSSLIHEANFSSLKYFSSPTSTQNDKDDDDLELYSNNTSNGRWLVASSKCHIPDIDPWDKSIKDYIKLNKPLNCTELLIKGKKLYLAQTSVVDNKLHFTEDAIKNGALKGKCCFRQIERSGENDTDLIYNELCQVIKQNDIQIPFEIIRVECKNIGTIKATQINKNQTQLKGAKRRGNVEYGNVHAFFVQKPEEQQVLDRAAEKNLNKNQYFNIVMLGIDTISRLNAYRQLNETMKVLRDKFKTIEYFGYNKVGENTFPNLIPLLTGLTPAQLVETRCWLTSNYTDENETGDEYLDDCKYLWSFYQEFGYMTYFSEDWPQASTFNYLKPGFRSEPTAYYGRPITLARQNYLVGSSGGMDCDICIAQEPIVKLDLNFFKSFISAYQSKPYFGFHWINCPQHDDMSGGSKVDKMIRQFLVDIHNITHDERTFVLVFSDHGWRWNNFIGTRVGHYESSLPLLTIAPPKRFIQQHPELYERLKSYQSSLLTPFDLFKTLIDIRNLAQKDTSSSGEDESKPERGLFSTVSSMVQSYTVGTTTFTQITPPNGITYKQDFKVLSLLDKQKTRNDTDRSCLDAGIPDNYCVCHEFKDVSVSSEDVLGAAYYLVYVHLNNRVKDGEKICVPLNLKKINKAERFDFTDMKSARKNRERRQVTSSKEVVKRISLSTTTSKPEETSEPDQMGETRKHSYLPNREYNLRVVTQPGDGIFQEVLRFYGEDLDKCKEAVLVAKKTIDSSSNDHVSKNKAVMSMNGICKFSIHSDSISRLNLYKDQSKCVKSNTELKKVCYCKDLLH